MRRKSLLKFTLTLIFACALAHSASAFCLISPCLPPPTHDWTVPAFGSRYGVLCYGYSTYVVFGSHRFFVTKQTKVTASTLMSLGMIVLGGWGLKAKKPAKHDASRRSRIRERIKTPD